MRCPCLVGSYRYPPPFCSSAAAHLRDPFLGVHSAAAIFRATVAGGRFFVVIEVVVPDQLFAGSDVAQDKDPDPALDLIDFAVGIAGVIQERAQAFSVNDSFSVFQSIQVGASNAVIAAVGLLWSDAGSSVFHDASSLVDWG